MHESPLRKDGDDYLDTFGQQPSLKIYTQICLCFSVVDVSLDRKIIDVLTKGLERLTASFPWLAGQVVNEDSAEGNSGIFKIAPLESIPRLVVKDLRHDAAVPTMDALRGANFPFSMLDESIIASRNTLPGRPNESASDSDPVFLLQANFITGGLLLTAVGQHNAMDMTGQGQIIYLLSKADSDSAKSIWTYFSFDSASLAALKFLAAETIAPPLGYVSTDDALSAFIWRSVIRARQPRLRPAAESILARAVDVRRHLNIPPTYPGLVQNMTYHTYEIQQLVEEPLGVVASELRLAVDPVASTLGYNTRALATVLERASDKSIVSVTATLDLSADIMLSSWAKLNSYELDFNLGLSRPEAVRRPQFVPVESLIYLMPRALDGEIAVAICLRDEDMERLRVDKEFMKYGKCIG
ncbi:MAG: hypothetical protein M1819_005892 [Sarea resinae]|nr:MAG: hypothetical protein M1819_005892 [Sarea resinae]